MNLNLTESHVLALDFLLPVTDSALMKYKEQISGVSGMYSPHLKPDCLHQPDYSLSQTSMCTMGMITALCLYFFRTWRSNNICKWLKILYGMLNFSIYFYLSLLPYSLINLFLRLPNSPFLCNGWFLKMPSNMLFIIISETIVLISTSKPHFIFPGFFLSRSLFYAFLSI